MCCSIDLEATKEITDKRGLVYNPGFLFSDQIFAMLTKWSEDEGKCATNEEIIYILEGAKMGHAVQNVFEEKPLPAAE
jgi:hypothetical protein